MEQSVSCQKKGLGLENAFLLERIKRMTRER